MSPLFKGEMLKLLRQPAILFWGFLFAPLFALIARAAIDGFVYLRAGAFASGQSEMFVSAAKAVGISGNSLAQLLFAIGIANIFFLEYRYSTWRHLVPRRSRVQLWAAKFLASMGLLSVSLMIAIVGDIALSVVMSVLGAGGGGFVTASGAVTLLIAFAVALLELAVLTAVVSTITILARSMIAAVIPAFLLAISSTMVQLYIGSSLDIVPLPALAADDLRAWLISGGSATRAFAGVAVLAGWLIVAGGLGCLAFWRQELSSE